jgi:hypothetical protein
MNTSLKRTAEGVVSFGAEDRVSLRKWPQTRVSATERGTRVLKEAQSVYTGT